MNKPKSFNGHFELRKIHQSLRTRRQATGSNCCHAPMWGETCKEGSGRCSDCGEGTIEINLPLNF